MREKERIKRKTQRGAAAVELALVLPLLLALIFGSVQFGWFVNNYLMLTNAAALGAHQLASERGYAAPYTDTANAINTQTGTLKGTLTISMSVGGTSCTSDSTCASALGSGTQAPAAGTQAIVQLGYTFAPLFGGALFGLKSIMPSSLSASMSEVVQ
ncbi:TadE/TadG family type IV pilus assembly protein [Paraburkholderia sp. Ac-20342]|uniref:TadE/TadG family type IV pilus assembly protein n=1 Tax=Paraburkholderia sp. Ac-20342 TaxID=2703889 RepID=UPI0019820782|nr:TadE/TadG family type IV pilus assembly protein [Paraburkholderia sp. Ac-20342]